MKHISLLILWLLSFSSAQSMSFDPQLLDDDSDFERWRAERIAENSGEAFLVVCCPLYTLCGLSFMAWAFEIDPTPAEIKAKTAQCVTSCCKKIKPLPGEFIEAQEKGMVKTLLGTAPKQIKME